MFTGRKTIEISLAYSNLLREGKILSAALFADRTDLCSD
jgi:hypothetical protein